MAVINILKDGTIVKDLTGYKVSREQVPRLYAVLDQINRECEKENDNAEEKGEQYAAANF